MLLAQMESQPPSANLEALQIIIILHCKSSFITKVFLFLSNSGAKTFIKSKCSKYTHNIHFTYKYDNESNTHTHKQINNLYTSCPWTIQADGITTKKKCGFLMSLKQCINERINFPSQFFFIHSILQRNQSRTIPV